MTLVEIYMLRIYIYIEYIYMLRIYIYMLPIAGQTAGPIGLNFFVDTQGWPGGVKGYFFKFLFSNFFFFHGQRRALQLILHITEGIYLQEGLRS